MRKGRNDRDRDLDAEVGADNADAGTLTRLFAGAARRPLDSLAMISAAAASLVIVVNALFLQPDAEPAPFVALPASASAEVRPDGVVGASKPVDVRPVEINTVATGALDAVQAHVPTATHSSQMVAVRHSDPIAELIGPSSRLAAAQRILGDYGYGQIKSSGVLDASTSAAIEKFEREHKMPVTGRLSDRLLNELAALAGRPL